MRVFLLLLILGLPAFAANTPPTPVIIRAEMRPGTTYMDVEYRVDDPDDATVRVRALAFVNGSRSFANILRPVTFVEGTAGNIGDNIRSGTKQTLTWNVGADWDIDLGQVKFEILALDSRGLLPFDWITIPAANGQPALTISKDAPSDAAVLNALFWLYADADPGLSLTNGVLLGNAQSGVFGGVTLATNATVRSYAAPFIFKKMNLDAASDLEVTYASGTARTGILNTSNWHAVNRPWQGISILVAWGNNGNGQLNLPNSNVSPIAIATGTSHCITAKSDGSVVGWGGNTSGQINIPAGLFGVTAVAAGGLNASVGGHGHSIALKSDGTIVGWGRADEGQTTIPSTFSRFIAIAAGESHSLALTSDGSVACWGSNSKGQSSPPPGLSGVTAVAAGFRHSLALKSNGTVVAWGNGQTTVPVGLTGVTAIAGGVTHSLAVKSDGTVVAWGDNSKGQCTVPPGLTGVTAIGAGENYSVALKSDGSVVAWGSNSHGQLSVPVDLLGVSAISAGLYHVLALKAKAP